MKKQVKIFIGLLFALSLAFAACKEETVIQTEKMEQLSVEDQQIVDYLVENGYKRDEIAIDEQGVAVGCMYLYRDYVKNVMSDNMNLEQNEVFDFQFDSTKVCEYSGIEERQRSVFWDKTVQPLHVATIRYFIHPSVSSQCYQGSQWVSAIATSVQNWNAITNCRINFIQESQQSTADVVISSDHPDHAWLPNGAKNLNNQNPVPIAVAPVTNGNRKEGPFVSINRASQTSNRVMAIMHELGHAIGFFHSNVVVNSNQYLHGTPDPDGTTSIMYATETTTTTFNDADFRAARLLYPDAVNPPSSWNAQPLPGYSGVVKITVSTPTITYPPYWLHVQRCNSSGTVIQEYWLAHTATTYNIGGIPQGTYKFRIRRTNLGRDITCAWTNYVTTTIP